MDFEVAKTEWLAFGHDDWGCITVNDEPLAPVKKIQILGYQFTTTGSDKAHVDYWLERGLEVGRRINALGRRFGSHRGIGSWEYMRLIKGVFLPTIWYGIKLLNGEDKGLKGLQVAINDSIQSIFHLFLITVTKCILSETGCVPTTTEWRYLQRKMI